MKSIFKVMACNLYFNTGASIFPGKSLGLSQGHSLKFHTFNNKENFKEKFISKLDKNFENIVNNIEEWNPDIIVLQQAGIFKLQDNSLWDLLQKVMIALKKKNIYYETVVENEGSFMELQNYNKEKIKYKDRNIILVSKKTSAKIVNSVSKRYEASLEGKNYHKGCCFIDLEKNLHRIRIISSILDDENLEISLKEQEKLIKSTVKEREATIIVTNFIKNNEKSCIDKYNLTEVNNNISSVMYTIPWEDIQVERKVIEKEDSLLVTLESENLLC